MKNKIIKLLKENKNNFISGQDISNKLGVSRTAIWKGINQLKEEGYEIESVSRKGYKLIQIPDILNYEEIKEYLNTKYIGRNINYFETIDSTNIKAKELALQGEKEGTVIISEEQTLGKGRLGRGWASPKYKGIWMSLILKPNIDIMKAPKITQIGAAAIVKALREMNIKSFVKWPNDIVLNNKKICGILTEMSGELNRISYVIMGIGINVNINKEDFSEEIRAVATSLKEEVGHKISRKELVGKVLNNFEYLYYKFVNEENFKETIDICKSHSALIGKQIKVINNKSTKIAKAVDLNDEGELVVQYENGDMEYLVSGEVSTRGLYGYVD
ncbi:bifunctional ligase/repressor BirA [Clostridium acetireducens DSM 10703]|uniref:Bifunctional ligase/repressor BirA n=1 Tax=Clostridium acetireducens DSM 10703 TaxID=1121290 RepID=A0A1E8EW57_9CLOT|nr:biotin--[acetyl-CoA-carboxylase] ligase [Clostridium acetireducens]OFI01495.1 bifunctional ligase/repressor BirA [Clostridium acetireducens DSM 10703]